MFTSSFDGLLRLLVFLLPSAFLVADPHGGTFSSATSGEGKGNLSVREASPILSILGDSSKIFDKNDEEVAFREQTNHEKRLLQYLMRNYDNSIRPVKNAKSPVIINLSITLTQIFDLDEKNQVLTTNVWLDQEWKDEFLVYPTEEFGNITKIRIPCEKIWLPDIVLYNNADDYTRGYMNSRAMIEPSGNVFWPPPTKFRSTCPVDVTYFPFDDQTCIMKLGSWIYDGLQVDILNRTEEVDLTNYVPNGEWDLLDASIVRNVVYYSCCPEPFPDVTITIKIRRKTLYYMYNVVFPCLMMSVLTLLVFRLPPDSGEKIALGVTVLLAFSVFMLAISEKLPETSESIPLLGIYLTAVMAITSVSVIMTVIVINIHYRGPSSKVMPDWLKKFLVRHMLKESKTEGESSTTSTGMSPPFFQEKQPEQQEGPSSSEFLSRRTRINYLPRSQSSYLETSATQDSFLPEVQPSASSPIPHPSLSSRTWSGAELTVIRERSSGDILEGQAPSSRHRSRKKFRRGRSAESANETQVRDRDSFFLTPLQMIRFQDAATSGKEMASDFQVQNTATTNPASCLLHSSQGWAHHPSSDRVKSSTQGHQHTQNHRRQVYPTETRGGNFGDPSLWSKFNHVSNVPHENHVTATSTRPYQDDRFLGEGETSQIPSNVTPQSTDEVLLILRYLLWKTQLEEEKSKTVHDWRLLAQAVDKILFWLFTVITLVSSISFLLLIPIQRRGFSFLFG